MSKKNKNDGKDFEKLVLIFFNRIFEELGFFILKGRQQFGGTQDGFDLQFIVDEEYNPRTIYIECKDYSTEASFALIYPKLHDLQSSYNLNQKNDLALFISPKKNFGNARNPEKAELVFNDGRYPFRICIFEPSHGIERFFALEPDIYEAVYGKPLTFTVDRTVELERFKRLLFYKTGQPYHSIPSSRKQKFLTSISLKRNHITRGVTMVNDPETDHLHAFNVLNRESDLYGLKDALEKVLMDETCSGIVLLGNPGMGKSIELERIALQTWEKRETDHWVPIYREIGSYNEGENLSDHFPDGWDTIPQLLIILDGLDEISHGPQFRKQIENFIQDYEGDQTIKFVISCRTNIYESNIRDIANFQCCTLNNLRLSKALEYLEEKFSMPSGYDYYQDVSRTQNEFFENPYYLNLLGEYHTKNEKLPTNKADLMEIYIQRRLEDDRRKGKEFDTGKIIRISKKVALTMEAMQSKRISGEDLSRLLEDDKSQFVGSSFTKRVFNKDAYEFEHKNLQEYFVAKTLDEMEKDQIIDFISLGPYIPKTHPSWLNSISYLLNLMDPTSDKFKYLAQWLETNDPTILFKTDIVRIPDKVRIKVFQKHFVNVCKEQTLWIAKYDPDTLDMVRFGDIKENREFLLKEVQDETNHRRTRISALGLLSQMDISNIQEEVKEIVICLLQADMEKVDLGFKVETLHIIRKCEFHKQEVFLKEIIDSVGELDHPRVSSALLGMIRETSSDEHEDFIKAITEVVTGKKQRKYPSKENSITGEEQNLAEALANFTEPKNQIFALKVFVENEHELGLESNRLIDLMNKMKEGYEKDIKIYDLLVTYVQESLDERLFLFRFERDIAYFFKETGTTEQAFNQIYDSDIPLEEKRHFLAHLVSEETMGRLITDYKDKKLGDKELFYFRNYLSSVDTDMALKFEKEVLDKTPYRLEGDLINTNLRQKWADYHRTKNQLSFDLLFDRSKLLEMTSDYFSYVGIDQVAWDDLYGDRDEFWKSLDLQKRFLPSFMDIVTDCLRMTHGKVTEGKVTELINNDLFILDKIKKFLTTKTKGEITEKQEQVDWIKNWCLANVDKADFKQAFTRNGDKNDYLCEFLWFFGLRYKVEYSEQNYLDLLWVDYHGLDNKAVGYGYIVEKVGIRNVKERVLKNFQKNIEPYHVYESHAMFILDHKISGGYAKIAEFVSDPKLERYRRFRILVKYAETTRDSRVLKNIFDHERDLDRETSMYWDALGTMIKIGETDEAIKEALRAKEEAKNTMDELGAIKYLLSAGYPKALEYFIEWLKQGHKYDRYAHRFFVSDDFSNFFNPDSIKDIVELIELSSKKELVTDDYFDPIRTTYELLKTFYGKASAKDFEGLIEELTYCRERLAKDGKAEMYHVNAILRETRNAYHKEKSKPMEFKEIAQRMNGFML